MVRVGGQDEGPGFDAQQIIFAHQPQHALVVDHHAAAAKLGPDTPVAIAAAMFKNDLLDRVAHFHVLFAGVMLFKKTIESGAADLRQPAHRLYTKAALRRHQFPDSFPDAVSPEPVALRRRAATFSQAAFKKSTSSVFLASAF